MPTSESTKLRLLFCFCLLFDSGYNSTLTHAQIVPDRTLPNNSTVNTTDNTVEINGGTTRGTNLFHSFSEFSLNNTATAYFNNSADINQIISRITGDSLSNINGLIKANGTADLFLINPNGIIFGNDAALNIGGSFISSTADSVQFEDGSEFSAVDPQANPLLTVSIPVGLQYGASADITVSGWGNELIFGNNHHLDRSSRPGGLEVTSGKTLALVGSNIFLSGGNLTAPDGNIQLGSVGENQTVGLTPDSRGWQLDYTNISNFGQIGLSEAASIDVSGNGGGKVGLKGGSINITAGSAILSNTLGDDTSGLLSIEAQEIEITGSNSDLDFSSGLFSIVAENARGNGANINLHTNKLNIEDGGQIALETAGMGNGGNLTINAEKINLRSAGGILARAITDIGNGGDIAIATDTLSIQDGATIYAGNLVYPSPIAPPDANINNLQLFDTAINTSAQSLDYSIIGTGEAGNITINANSIILDSANAEISSISTATFAQGGGIIKLDSQSISVGNNGQITTETKGDSYGGGIYLRADTIELNHGGKLSTSTYAGGDAGKILIETNQLTADGNGSGIFSYGKTGSNGSTGKIGITTDLLDLNNGSSIDSINLGLGNRGAIDIQATQSNIAEDLLISSVDEKTKQPGNINGDQIRIDFEFIRTSANGDLEDFAYEIEPAINFAHILNSSININKLSK